MKLTEDQISDWKLIGNFLARGWARFGPGPDDEAYIPRMIREHPCILSNRLWFEILRDKEGEYAYFRQLLKGGLPPDERVFNKPLIPDPVSRVFFEAVESLWNEEMALPFDFDRAAFLDHLIDEDPEVSEMMFVVAANNLELEAGVPVNATAAFRRGIEAAMNYCDRSFVVTPPIEAWESIG